MSPRHLVASLLVLALLVSIVVCSAGCDYSTGPSSYVGNKNSKVFHRPSCSYLPSPENRVYFSTRQDAVNAGYTPCSYCKP